MELTGRRNESKEGIRLRAQEKGDDRRGQQAEHADIADGQNGRSQVAEVAWL